MAILKKNQKRRVRIVSEPGELRGWKVTITDAETGEEIRNVYRAVITLDARKLNAVELFYYESDEQSEQVLTIDGKKPVEGQVESQFPHVAVEAWEWERTHPVDQADDARVVCAITQR